ncbi:2-hydroxyglutaryl-CoA dehydratase subunit HgdB [Geoglobus acetivorans]|uniref:2-hydroxyglutaryl-CoA dehydratase subunit HgdB n=1 Tax=Geoglobus acetivorans TaxID=565033 RepID=A0A0A7GFX5_GEOAI|nr:2-hydroxyglutaryl-CoA dehydratase subunit HgdB [Geoglobus acetivorans]
MSDSVDELFARMKNAVDNRAKIKEYREKGMKVIGTLCNNVPEEIIHSAKAVPVRVFGNYGSTPNASSVMPQWTCYYARNVMEAGLRGETDYLDGIASTTSDDTKIHLFSLYRFYLKPEFSYMVQYPFSRDEKSRKFFIKELERFSSFLSKFTGSETDAATLKKSIEVYNAFRKICMKLERLRSEDEVKISASEWMLIMLSSMHMLKEDFNRIAEELYRLLSEREGNGDYILRVHVSGTDFYSSELLEILENHGIAVVSDDFCTSTGYHHGIINRANLEGIADRYLQSTACVMTSASNELSVHERAKFIRDRIKASRAEAVIVFKDRGCEVCGHQCPAIIDELDLPVLTIDLDFPLSKAQIEGRIEAFVESHGR